MGETPRYGMFATVHREQTSPPPVQEESSTVVSSLSEGVHPGAVAVGGRQGAEADDDYTVTQEESVSPALRSRRNTNEEIPIAAELSPEENENSNAADRRRMVDDAPLVTAEPTEPRVEDEDEKEPRVWISKRRLKCILVAFILFVVGIVVAVVLLVSDDDGSNPANTDTGNPDDDNDSGSRSNATPAPTSSPSVSPAPTSLFDRMFDLLSAYSGEAVLLETTTPQYQALQWVLGDVQAGDWSDDVILERYALASLFHSTEGGRWLDITEFVVPLSYCDWGGVGCKDGLLTSVTLPSQNLLGTLPPEIGVLTSLVSLDLSNNRLTGSIPTEIGFLTDLEVLQISLPGDRSRALFAKEGHLRRNLEDAFTQPFLTGPIPSEVGLMTSLVALDMSHNNISGSIPSEVGDLTDLVNLSLQGNDLSGDIPLQLGFLLNLEHLSIENTQLLGVVPNGLCSIASSIQELSADCLADIEGDKPAEVVCKCCNICCDADDVCRSVDVTAFPSSSPSTSFPSVSPSSPPTEAPSRTPSSAPSALPSPDPSSIPSFVPSMSPSFNPTPSGTPQPTVTASQPPTNSPTLVPSSRPSLRPTDSPTVAASMSPTRYCPNDENSCIGNRACNGAVELCTESGSCSGRNACRSATDLRVAQGSCVGKSNTIEFLSYCFVRILCPHIDFCFLSYFTTGTSACQAATGSIASGSCASDNSCTGFDGVSIGSNSCNVSC